MAKAGTEVLYPRSGVSTSIEIQINFYTKTKNFQVINFPEEITNWYASKINQESGGHHQGQIVADTYDGCKEKAQQVYDDYTSQTVTECRVILYKLAYSNKSGAKMGQVHFAPTVFIGLEYVIRWKISVGNTDFYSSANYENTKQPDTGVRCGGPRFESVKSSDYSKYQEVPHTDEMEKFFSSTMNSLDILISKVALFFGSDSSKLLENISNGTKLLGNE